MDPLMKSDPDPTELTPHELALLACYQDGALAPGDLLEAERLLERSEAAREIISEASALLDDEPGEVVTLAGGAEPPEPEPQAGVTVPEARISSPRMGWRTFLPLAAAGVVGMVVLWPGGEPLDLVAWSDSLIRQGGGESFTFPVVRGEARQEALAETAGILWVDLRIALQAHRAAEADSLAGALSATLATVTGSGPARGRIEALIGGSPPPPVAELEAIQRALVEQLGHPFEEAAILETLRRAARVGAADLAAELVEHPHLNDDVGEDLHPDTRSRLLELCEDDLTAEEFAEMEAIVTEILRQRT